MDDVKKNLALRKKSLAQIVYIFAIILLALCTVVIVGRLLFFPPCSQVGNACVVDGWSVAGLAASVLGVSATVLAILGAVAVAGWWIWLNERVTKLVTGQVTQLYNQQNDNLIKKFDTLLNSQIEKADNTIALLETRLIEIDNHIDIIKDSASNVEDTVIEGLMVLGPTLLEDWAKQSIKKRKEVKVPIKMAEGYKNVLGPYIVEVIKSKGEVQKELDSLADQYQKLLLNDMTGSYSLYMTMRAMEGIQINIEGLKTTINNEQQPFASTFTHWEGTLRWLQIAMEILPQNDTVSAGSVKLLIEKTEDMRDLIDEIRNEQNTLNGEIENLTQEVTKEMKQIAKKLSTVTQ